MSRTYSANPQERFVTGGGVQSFTNFDNTYNQAVLDVWTSFRQSVNLPFVRMMREVVNHYMYRVPGSTAHVLEERGTPLRQEYLARFADREGIQFLNQFIPKYRGRTRVEILDALFAELERTWGRLDFLVHAIAFSDKNELDGRYVDTSEENFTQTMLVSCYSLTALARRAEKLMTDGGSIITLTYYGAEKVMPHYNVMGVAKAALEASVRYLAADLGKNNIRVNAISAGPIKTLAASGIADFRYILRWNEYNSPLRRTVTLDDVGGSGVYLLSDLSKGVTGEVHHVDAGYHVQGMKNEDAPDISVVKSDV